MDKLTTLTKLFVLFIATTLVFTSSSLLYLLCFMVIVAVCSMIFNRNKFWERFKLLGTIGIMIICFQLLFGTATLHDRFINGIFSAVKIGTASLSVFLFMSIISPGELLKVFTILPKGLKLIVAITFSLIPVILKEEFDIRLVQKTRGRGGIMSVIIPLLHRTLQRSETMSMSAISRGFQ